GPILKEGVNKLADWLNKFSVELASQKFQNAVSMLVSDTGTIAKGLHVLANEIRLYMGWRHPGHEIAEAAKGIWQGFATGGSGPGGKMFLSGGSASNLIGGAGRFASTANGLDQMFGFPAGT